MSRMRPILIVMFTFALVLSACAPPAPSPEELQQTIDVAVGLTALAQTGAAPTASLPPPADTNTPLPPTEAPTDTPAPSATSSVAVVFTPGGLFDEAKRAEFYARIINPYIAYHAPLSATEGYPNLVSINIQTFDLADYPYGADAIFDNGGYEGWLIGESGGVVNYWIPECMDSPCPLSPAFATAFPEIAATVGAP